MKNVAILVSVLSIGAALLVVGQYSGSISLDSLKGSITPQCVAGEVTGSCLAESCESTWNTGVVDQNGHCITERKPCSDTTLCIIDSLNGLEGSITPECVAGEVIGSCQAESCTSTWNTGVVDQNGLCITKRKPCLDTTLCIMKKCCRDNDNSATCSLDDNSSCDTASPNFVGYFASESCEESCAMVIANSGDSSPPPPTPMQEDLLPPPPVPGFEPPDLDIPPPDVSCGQASAPMCNGFCESGKICEVDTLFDPSTCVCTYPSSPTLSCKNQMKKKDMVAFSDWVLESAFLSSENTLKDNAKSRATTDCRGANISVSSCEGSCRAETVSKVFSLDSNYGYETITKLERGQRYFRIKATGQCIATRPCLCPQGTSCLQM